jgi:hypothetical protein
MSIDKYNFWDIFQDNLDGSLVTKPKLNVNGVNVEPGSVIKPGTAVGGIDFSLYKNLDVAGEYDGDVLSIKGFFRKP